MIEFLRGMAIVFFMVFVAVCTNLALEFHSTKPIESELLCKQVHKVNSRTNIVLECVEKGAIYGMD